MIRFVGICMIFLALLFTKPELLGQHTSLSIGINNNSTSLPITGYPSLFTKAFHPGLALSGERSIWLRPKQELHIGANLNTYYHHHVQTLVRIYPDVAYTYHLSKRFYARIELGFGFGLGFEGKQAIKLDDKGQYVSKSALNFRPQWVGGIEWGLSYALRPEALSSPKIVLGFKTFVQGTYVASYVPFLPLNSFEVGIQIPLKTERS